MSMTVRREGPPQLEDQGKPGGKNGQFTPEQIQRHSDASQAYWFAVNARQNQQNQENTSQSNMQKNTHDALMSVVNNLK